MYSGTPAARLIVTRCESGSDGSDCCARAPLAQNAANRSRSIAMLIGAIPRLEGRETGRSIPQRSKPGRRMAFKDEDTSSALLHCRAEMGAGILLLCHTAEEFLLQIGPVAFCIAIAGCRTLQQNLSTSDSKKSAMRRQDCATAFHAGVRIFQPEGSNRFAPKQSHVPVIRQPRRA